MSPKSCFFVTVVGLGLLGCSGGLGEKSTAPFPTGDCQSVFQAAGKSCAYPLSTWLFSKITYQRSGWMAVPADGPYGRRAEIRIDHDAKTLTVSSFSLTNAGDIELCANRFYGSDEYTLLAQNFSLATLVVSQVSMADAGNGQITFQDRASGRQATLLLEMSDSSLGRTVVHDGGDLEHQLARLANLDCRSP